MSFEIFSPRSLQFFLFSGLLQLERTVANARQEVKADPRWKDGRRRQVGPPETHRRREAGAEVVEGRLSG